MKQISSSIFKRSDLIVFFFTDTATTTIYTLSLHDALPIYVRSAEALARDLPALLEEGIAVETGGHGLLTFRRQEDRKSTRLNSSHPSISYAVFCLKKKM